MRAPSSVPFPAVPFVSMALFVGVSFVFTGSLQAQTKGYPRGRDPWTEQRPGSVPIEKTSNFPDGMLVQEIQEPLGSRPDALGRRRTPELQRATGRLTMVRQDVKSADAWSGVDARLYTEGGALPLSHSHLVPRPDLQRFQGATVEVLLHPQQEARGSWGFLGLDERPHVEQGPVGHGEVFPIHFHGELIGFAQWHAARRGGHEVLAIRRLGPGGR